MRIPAVRCSVLLELGALQRLVLPTAGGRMPSPNQAVPSTSISSIEGGSSVTFLAWTGHPKAPTPHGSFERMFRDEYSDTHVEAVVLCLMSALEVHPNLLLNKMKFWSNPARVLHRVHRMLAIIGEHAPSLDYGPVSAMETTYSKQGEFTHDDKEVDSLKRRLQHNALFLDIDKLGVGNLHVDVDRMNTYARAKRSRDGNKHYVRFLKRYFSVVPFIYDHSGNAVRKDNYEVESHIASMNAGILHEICNHSYRNVYAPLITPALTNAAIQVFQSFINNDLKTIQKALIPRPKDGSDRHVEIRRLSLEEVPALISLLRGMIACDCSMQSVPFHSLLRGTKVFFIRKSHNYADQPVGYLFVAEAKIQGERSGISVPYITTIAGSALSQSDVIEMIKMVASYYRSSEIAVPDFDINPNAADEGNIMRGMTFDNSEPATVIMPEGWDVVDGHTKHRVFSNYYLASKLSRARVVRLSNIGAEFSHTCSADMPPTRHATQYSCAAEALRLSLKGRSNLAYYIHENFKEYSGEDVMTTLDALRIGEGQLHAAKAIYGATFDDPVDMRKYMSAWKMLGDFSIEDIRALDLDVRTASLVRLHAEQSVETHYFGGEEFWNREYDELNILLNKEMEKALKHKNYSIVTRLLCCKDKLPDTFRELPANIWTMLPDACRSTTVAVHEMLIKTLEYQLPNKMWEEVPRLMRDAEWYVRWNISSALGSQRMWPPEVWAEVPALMADVKKYVRVSISNSLKSQPIWPADVETQAMALMNDPESQVREAIAAAVMAQCGNKRDRM